MMNYAHSGLKQERLPGEYVLLVEAQFGHLRWLPLVLGSPQPMGMAKRGSRPVGKSLAPLIEKYAQLAGLRYRRPRNNFTLYYQLPPGFHPTRRYSFLLGIVSKSPILRIQAIPSSRVTSSPLCCPEQNTSARSSGSPTKKPSGHKPPIGLTQFCEFAQNFSVSSPFPTSYSLSFPGRLILKRGAYSFLPFVRFRVLFTPLRSYCQLFFGSLLCSTRGWSLQERLNPVGLSPIGSPSRGEEGPTHLGRALSNTLS